MIARLQRGAGIAVVLVLGAIWFVAFRPTSLGGPTTYLVVRGDSMEPTYRTGDLVILRTAEGYGIGDVVAYRVPAGDIGAGHLVVHRIAGGDAATGFLMQGDGNPSVDPWTPRTGDIAGRAWVLLPGAGRLFTFAHQPAVVAAIAVALFMAFLVLRWPTVRRSTPAAAENPAR